MALAFRKLNPHLAAEVGAIDLRSTHDRAMLDEIRAGMDDVRCPGVPRPTIHQSGAADVQVS